ncbi:MAG: GNAT family N-acetyltransferase [Pseudomonadota bacterium]
MDIKKVDSSLAQAYEEAIPDMVYSTGPSSYDYYFQSRPVFNMVVEKSWAMPGTLFAQDVCHLALDEGKLAGFLLSFEASEFRPRGDALAPVWHDLFEAGLIDEAGFADFLERAEYARWLNPETRPGIYYIHAIAAHPDHKGRGVGVALIDKAVALAKERGFNKIELDVLSDNPAVGFYHARGFEIVAETKAPKPFAAGVPVEYRMSLTL